MDANAASWQAMIDKFPPLPAESTPDEPSGDVEFLDLGSYDSQPDLVRDILWTYENLARRDINAKDAPGLGAWDLLQWARKSRNRFFEQVLPKAMAVKEKQPERDEQVVEDPGIEEIKQMLVDAHLHWERDAVANTDETIKRTVNRQMSEWEHRFQLELGAGPRESWMLQMIKLVDDTIRVVLRNPEKFQSN